MTYDELVGEWREESGGTRIELRPDGSVRFLRDAAGTDEGSWRYLDKTSFSVRERVPGHPGSRHNSDGYDHEITWEIVSREDDRLVLEVRESSEGDFAYDPTVWVRVGPLA